MSGGSIPALADEGLAARVAELIERHGISAVVETGAGDGASTRRFAQMAEQVLAIEIRPELLAAARQRLAEQGIHNVRLLQGPSARVLADQVPRLPAQTLYFLDASGLPEHPGREEIFHVPRGQGVIALRAPGGDARALYARLRDQLLRWSPRHRVDYHEGPAGGVAFVLPAPRVHVTFLIERYTHGYRTSGPSVNLDNVVATLQQTGLATYDCVFYDERYHEHQAITLDDVGKPPGADTHLLVCTCHYHSPANPAPELLRRARASGSKIVFMWLDRRTSIDTPQYYELADVNLVFDGNDFDLPRAWPVFTPKNPMHFNDPGLARDIDVSLIGEMRHLKQRQDLIARLEQETRIRTRVVRTSAVDPARMLPVADYARILQTSKISIALTKDATRQLKGRIFEIVHCGAMLMCDVNPYINTYFTPGVEYVCFRDYEDLVAKCAHYLAHEDERRRIARAGRDKAIRYYDYRMFWRSLLARAGVAEV